MSTWYEVFGWKVRECEVVKVTPSTVVVREDYGNGVTQDSRHTRECHYYPTKLEALQFLRRKAYGNADFHQKLANDGCRRVDSLDEEIAKCQ